MSPQRKNLGMGESVYFSLFFPPIPEDSKYIEINENIENGFHFVIKLESDVNHYLQQYAAMEEYARKEEEEYARRRAARMMWEKEQERKRNQNQVKNPKERRKTLTKDPDFKID